MKTKLIISLIIVPLLTISSLYAMENKSAQLIFINKVSIEHKTDLENKKKELLNKPNKHIALSEDFEKTAGGAFNGHIYFSSGQLRLSFQGSSDAIPKILTFNKNSTLLAAYFVGTKQSEIKIWQTDKIEKYQYEPLCATIIQSSSPILNIQFSSNNTIAVISDKDITEYRIAKSNIQSEPSAQPVYQHPISHTYKKIEIVPSAYSDQKEQTLNFDQKEQPQKQSFFSRFGAVGKWMEENQTLAACLWAGAGMALFCTIRFGLIDKFIGLLR